MWGNRDSLLAETKQDKAPRGGTVGRAMQAYCNALTTLSAKLDSRHDGFGKA